MKQAAGKAVFAGILGIAAGTAALLVLLHFRARPHFIQQSGARMAALPRVTLWAWERPESFHNSEPGGAFAVAYLDQTVQLVPNGVTSRPRMVVVTFPPGTIRIAVVRIEAAPGADLSATTLASATRLLLLSANRPGIAAFQVDFDARSSERDFYRQLLLRLRAAMPPTLPLSITALASWCAYDDWIRDLPVDEAVPMFFRMEPAWRHAALSPGQDWNEFKMREPLCAQSIGLSNTGPWPPVTDGRRIYLFADSGWTPQAVKSAVSRVP